MPLMLQVDAFTDTAFAGNPAAVCLLEQPADEAWMQRVASEMNLSETAFVVPDGDVFGLRWFTPLVEVELCGHATLATAHTIWKEAIVPGDSPIRFSTKSGQLVATRSGQMIELDFPATPASEVACPDGVESALGIKATWAGENAYDKLLIVATEQEVLQLRPNFADLATTTDRGVIVSSLSTNSQYDFVSRFFAPAAGIDEDPVTGSAHCTLAPYWAKQLKKTSLTGYQASLRGGIVAVEMRGDRAALRGQAVSVLRGELLV